MKQITLQFLLCIISSYSFSQNVENIDSAEITLTVPYCTKTNIKSSNLCKSPGLYVYIEDNTKVKSKLKVISFRLNRSGRMVGSFGLNKTSKFQKTIKNKLCDLKKNDTIHFVDIIVEYPNGAEVKLKKTLTLNVIE